MYDSPIFFDMFQPKHQFIGDVMVLQHKRRIIQWKKLIKKLTMTLSATNFEYLEKNSEIDLFRYKKFDRFIKNLLPTYPYKKPRY